jgi:hypothetical protein
MREGGFSLFLASSRCYRLIGREHSVAFFSGFLRSDSFSEMSPCRSLISGSQGSLTAK